MFLKTQIFEKRANFLAKKLDRPKFSRIVEYGKPQGTTYTGSQVIVTVIVQGIRSFI